MGLVVHHHPTTPRAVAHVRGLHDHRLPVVLIVARSSLQAHLVPSAQAVVGNVPAAPLQPSRDRRWSLRCLLLGGPVSRLKHGGGDEERHVASLRWLHLQLSHAIGRVRHHDEDAAGEGRALRGSAETDMGPGLHVWREVRGHPLRRRHCRCCREGGVGRVGHPCPCHLGRHETAALRARRPLHHDWGRHLGNCRGHVAVVGRGRHSGHRRSCSSREDVTGRWRRHWRTHRCPRRRGIGMGNHRGRCHHHGC
mmetsp:Transcript_104669/g.223746  ORF Transcript_104669/g.223746 Transcript_104669/m.223746 type:complete len:252 (-) Transcript_104669:66-821(-)